jgi:hypothetical protein
VSNAPQPKKSRSSVERDLEQACSDLLAYDNWRSLKTDPQSERGFARRLQARFANHPILHGFLDAIMRIVHSCVRDSGFGELGMCDRLYIRYTYGDLARHGLIFDHPAKMNEIRSLAQILWIEWKRPGGKPDTHQTQWHLEERLRGALVVVAGADFPADVNGFLSWYRGSGLMRRPL